MVRRRWACHDREAARFAAADRSVPREMHAMAAEKIRVEVTETGTQLEVEVISKSANRIEVLIGTGQHSTRCVLVPNRMETAYSGNAMGRELVYARSRKAVQADVDKVTPRGQDFRRH
jgi:hypothetical protein